MIMEISKQVGESSAGRFWTFPGPVRLVFRHDPKQTARLGLFGPRRLVRHEVAGGIGFFKASADDAFGHGADMGDRGREGWGYIHPERKS